MLGKKYYKIWFLCSLLFVFNAIFGFYASSMHSTMQVFGSTMQIEKGLDFSHNYAIKSNNDIKNINDLLKKDNYFHTSAKACALIDANTSRVFFQVNSNTKLPMASTTKIVTAITVIDNCKNLDEIVTIPAEAVGIEGTSIYLRTGEQLTVKELLYGLMLRSGNDAAVALAIHIGGSVATFCELMNNLAVQVGAINSHFTNPHGLDDAEHYTTAFDLAQITSYALSNETFSEIVRTSKVKVASQEEETRLFYNKNKLLSSLDGCIGVKTGYTSKAGRCLVSACERDGLKVVCVVLNCGPMFEESADMINTIYENYKNYSILQNYNYMDAIPVQNGEQNFVQIYSRNGLSLTLTEEEYGKINFEYDIAESVSAPVKEEQIVGKIYVYYEKYLIFSENIYTMDSVKSKMLSDKVKDILEHW